MHAQIPQNKLGHVTTHQTIIKHSMIARLYAKNQQNITLPSEYSTKNNKTWHSGVITPDIATRLAIKTETAPKEKQFSGSV